jgi:hypothetical protein
MEFLRSSFAINQANPKQPANNLASMHLTLRGCRASPVFDFRIDLCCGEDDINLEPNQKAD